MILNDTMWHRSLQVCELKSETRNLLPLFKIRRKSFAMTCHIRLQLHGAIYRPDSFVLMLRYCGNLKEIKYE